MNALKITAEKFLAYNPTLLGSVYGWKLYEHPTKGDEAPVIAICPKGTVYNTCEFEYTDAYDLIALN